MDKAQSGDEKYSHIVEKDINTVVETIANCENWLSNNIARQAERANDLKPIITSAEILKKKDEYVLVLPFFSYDTDFVRCSIFAVVNPIMTKPRPKAKVEETKKEKKEDAPSAEATPETGTPMEEDAIPGATVEEVVDDAPVKMDTDDID